MASVLGTSLSTVLLLAGLVLVVLEGFAPGAHFIVLGVALLAAGLLGILVPGAANPLVLGLTVLLAGAGSYYVYRHFEFYKGTDRGKTEGSAELMGRRGYVTERVTPRTGRVKLSEGGFDPTYAARSVEGEIDVGAEIIVVDPGGGNVVEVEALSEVDDIDRELERGRAREADVEAETEDESAR
ncbi:NfeD family protein [Halodesulfurarchaeum sp. HSR-GB]|uniref:NfeD family protein n=1 Tax=Halodesulfurarchaeum sp. HSR-GB TaxID=3074077 RepID=UPI002858BC26|nr:NfeD family protein [Halodesulfurarchaeum sp. HSR-GB]MDR5656794.1 NfeD family protein [Halodesulfurarchaeum sp. HSR-GB]